MSIYLYLSLSNSLSITLNQYFSPSVSSTYKISLKKVAKKFGGY